MFWRRVAPVFLVAASAFALDHVALQKALDAQARSFAGRTGVCVKDAAGMTCVNGDQRFSLQSVVKLLTGVAAMDAVEHKGWHLTDPVLIRRQDLSIAHQPLAAKVGADGYRTTIDDLIRRAINDSDSAANDVLMDKLGGAQAVNAFLVRKGIKGMRVDRDERHLQTESIGLRWKPEYVDVALLKKDIAALPDDIHTKAYLAYQKDVRDTATPRAMAQFLERLAAGHLLDAAGTKYILDVLEKTATGLDRLKAGLKPGWRVGHKTGTSGTWKGLTVATNDVGILTAPGGKRIFVAVFVADSKASDAERAAYIATVAAEIVAKY
ncbi:MAG: class A beta-lactamase [Bryobacterales bacterium]|nr:class A beta-lactamase [Bryobacterales bacterium]